MADDILLPPKEMFTRRVNCEPIPAGHHSQDSRGTIALIPEGPEIMRLASRLLFGAFCEGSVDMLALPEASDWILTERLVPADNRNTFNDGLRHEQTVKRVFVI
jgi:hypothetical protein